MNSTKKNGFTLIELMIVIAIVGILASVAGPLYVKYTKRAKFISVVQETVKFKIAAEAAYQLGFTNLDDFESGAYGIPPKIDSEGSNKPTSVAVGTVEMKNGSIIAVGTEIVDSKIYKITATDSNDGLRWTVDIDASTCLAEGLCSI